MLSNVAHDLLILLFIVQLLVLSTWWTQQRQPIGFKTYRASATRPRPLRPRTPDDCPECRAAASTLSQTSVAAPVTPYSKLKSRRGRKKLIVTAGYACPNVACDYFNNTDPTIHALVGYGHHGQTDPTQDLYCQACHHKFSVRRHTALYHSRTPPARVAQVLHAVAEALSPRAASRVFNLSETTIRIWLTRAGLHSRNLHDRLVRGLTLIHVQLDELRLKVKGMTEAAWLWVACDARTKLIPAFALGGRTQALAHQLVHEVAHRLAPDCFPVFSSDGLALYFYALTAHFGAWVQTASERRRRWVVHAQLLYAQVIKRYCHKRVADVGHHVFLGTAARGQSR